MSSEAHRALVAAGARESPVAHPASRPTGRTATAGFTGPRPSQVPVIGPSREVNPGVAEAIERERGRGHSLAEDSRSRAEAVLGADLGQARVHTGVGADALSRSLEARAFTTGSDIFFRRGAYNPGSRDGLRLIAHELAHVVQQRGAPTHGRLTVGSVDDGNERAARSAGNTVAAGSIAAQHVPGPVGRGAPAPFATRRITRLHGSTGHRAGSRVLARQPDVAVHDDDRHVEAVSPDVGGVRDIDIGWYRRLEAIRVGGRLRVDEGSPFKDPVDLRVDALALQSPSRDQLFLDGSVQLDGFDVAHGELQLRVRFRDPTKPKRAPTTATPDDLWKELEPALREAVPGLDPARLAVELTALLGRLAAGDMTPEAFVRAVEKSVRRATKEANVHTVEKALWPFLAKVGAELDATGAVIIAGRRWSRLHGRARFTAEGPEASYSVRGLILAPPGAVTSTFAPAVGSFKEKRSLQVHERSMFGILQKLDPDAIGRKGSLLVEKFPTSGYWEYSRARRFGDDLEVGIRIGVRASTSDIARYVPHARPSLSASDELRSLYGSYQDIVHPRVHDGKLVPLADPSPPLLSDIPYNAGITFVVRFK